MAHTREVFIISVHSFVKVLLSFRLTEAAVFGERNSYADQL